MTTNQQAVWARSLEHIDREVGRLALLSQVRIPERGVSDRVLRGDRSVCGTDNPRAFAKWAICC